MNVLCVIPARSGSKGIPHKNIIPLAGRPLITWTIETSLACAQITRTIVSTDSPEYARIAISAGAEVPFLRPKEISDDTSSDFQFMQFTLNQFALTGYAPDLIVHLRPTTPLRRVEVVSSAIETFIKNDEFTSLRSVHPTSESAYKLFEVVEDRQLVSIFTRSRRIELSNQARQSFPPTYSANGYVDVLRSVNVSSGNTLHGDRVLGYITEFTPEIDTIQDLEFVEFMLSRKTLGRSTED